MKNSTGQNRYETLKNRILNLELETSRDARREISMSLVQGQISHEEHVELRQLLISTYKN